MKADIRIADKSGKRELTNRVFKRQAKTEKGLGSEKGFTLIELLVTTTIIGILAAVVSIGVGGASTTATTKANAGTFNQVQTAIDAYQAAGNSLTSVTACGTITANGTCPSASSWYDVAGATATPGATNRILVLTDLTTAPAWLRLEGNTTLRCILTAASTPTSATLFACANN